jgi:hypothetical protein
VGVDAVFDPSIYATKYKSSSPHTTPKSPDKKTAGASSSSLINVDAVSDPSVYGTKDVPTPNMSVKQRNNGIRAQWPKAHFNRG